jgi:sulfite reductase alpha subunit-like flavoprotein
LPAGLSYSAGDVVNILPSNEADYVDMVFEATGWSRDTVLDYERKDKLPVEAETSNSFPVQLPATLETLIREEFDLIGIPRRHFFAVMALYSEHEVEKERLEEFCASDGTDDRWDYANRPRRSLAESLLDFPNSIRSFPLRAIFELFPLIRPRPYSICSYSSIHIEILAAVVRYRSRMSRPRIGICSSYLKQLTQDDDVMIKLTKGTFRLPPDGPLIMIGPGTGLAPFRSIIEYRQSCLIDLSSSILFFGCRSPDSDFYFKNEFSDLTRITAFSRDKKIAKEYVQDKIRQNFDLIFDLVNLGGVILIAGKAQDMPDQVKDALVDCFIEKYELEKDDAISLIETLEQQGRLQQETW